METLKALRAKAKELREKCMTKSLTKASADEIKREISFFERAEKAEAARQQRLENLQMKEMAKQSKKASIEPVEAPEKKKSTKPLVKRVVEPTPKVRKMKKEIDSSEE